MPAFLPIPKNAARREDSVNPPHNLPKENLTAEERERRIKEANRQYFKASGSIDAFYAAYPYERPPGYEPEPRLKPQRGRERGGRGSREGC